MQRFSSFRFVLFVVEVFLFFLCSPSCLNLTSGHSFTPLLLVCREDYLKVAASPTDDDEGGESLSSIESAKNVLQEGVSFLCISGDGSSYRSKSCYVVVSTEEEDAVYVRYHTALSSECESPIAVISAPKASSVDHSIMLRSAESVEASHSNFSTLGECPFPLV